MEPGKIQALTATLANAWERIDVGGMKDMTLAMDELGEALRVRALEGPDSSEILRVEQANQEAHTLGILLLYALERLDLLAAEMLGRANRYLLKGGGEPGDG